MIIVFDMDDTVYDEITYVKSGFKAVSHFLKKEFLIPPDLSYEIMVEELKNNGRGKVFNVVLEKYGKLTKSNVRKCISTYRLHQPDISLNEDAIRCFKRFKDYPLYIVTDGNKVAQGEKVKALQLENIVKKVFITYRYGKINSKPSPYCFNKIAKIENSKPENIVYIGDNPKKDFVGIKPLGYKTVRILKGEYKDLEVDKNFDAHLKIKSLDELTQNLFKQFT